MNKASSTSSEKVHAFLGGYFWSKWSARRDARSGRKLEFGRTLTGISEKILSTPFHLPLSGGGGLHAASRTPACSLWNSACRPVCTDTKILRKTPQHHDKCIYLRRSLYNQIDKHILNKFPGTLKNGVQFSERKT